MRTSSISRSIIGVRRVHTLRCKSPKRSLAVKTYKRRIMLGVAVWDGGGSLFDPDYRRGVIRDLGMECYPEKLLNALNMSGHITDDGAAFRLAGITTGFKSMRGVPAGEMVVHLGDTSIYDHPDAASIYYPNILPINLPAEVLTEEKYQRGRGMTVPGVDMFTQPDIPNIPIVAAKLSDGHTPTSAELETSGRGSTTPVYEVHPPYPETWTLADAIKAKMSGWDSLSEDHKALLTMDFEGDKLTAFPPEGVARVLKEIETPTQVWPLDNFKGIDNE